MNNYELTLLKTLISEHLSLHEQQELNEYIKLTPTIAGLAALAGGLGAHYTNKHTKPSKV